MPSDGVNLLVNGSFEANTLSAGQWGGYTTMSGWTALSGSKIELWNDLNEVKASQGSNFGELTMRENDAAWARHRLRQHVLREQWLRHVVAPDEVDLTFAATHEGPGLWPRNADSP